MDKRMSRHLNGKVDGGMDGRMGWEDGLSV